MRKGGRSWRVAILRIMSTYMSTRQLVPVSPAEPIIIGTSSSRAASSMCSRSCSCQAAGLAQVSLPSGTGPMSSLPESAAM